jgi:formylmethanofuran dehydrogenase subunit B
MTDASAARTATGRPWTCPFCPLACDHVGVRADDNASTASASASTSASRLALEGDECERASRALSHFTSQPSDAVPMVDGKAVDIHKAIGAAVELLRRSRQPLFGGLGTDVAGARSLYRLACKTGAISDAASGDALMFGLRALQDRGQYTTTLAEVRTRADLIVFIGGVPIADAPLIGRRCGIGDPQVAKRHVVVVGPNVSDAATMARWAAHEDVTVESVPLQGDLFDSVSLLSALTLAATKSAPAPAPAPSALHALATRMSQAKYAVIIGTPAALPAQGALIVEAVNQIVGALNRSTRAASMWIGGGGGAATTNQVFAWLSGVPLRSRAGPLGLEHEPLIFDAAHLLNEGSVDSLLWISSFDAELPPPPNGVPMIVLGHPALADESQARDGVPTVFIPVSTPGIGGAGHVFRCDGTILMPLTAVYLDRLPSVAEVLDRIAAHVAAETPDDINADIEADITSKVVSATATKERA